QTMGEGLGGDATGIFDTAPGMRAAPDEPPVGDGWLLAQGYTLVWSGWQHDVPAGSGRMRIEVPEALEAGRRVAGNGRCQLQVDEPAQVLILSHGGHVPYPAADPAEKAAVLHVRDYPDGPAAILDRSRWRFGRLDGDREVPSPEHVHLPEGFEK